MVLSLLQLLSCNRDAPELLRAGASPQHAEASPSSDLLASSRAPRDQRERDQREDGRARELLARSLRAHGRLPSAAFTLGFRGLYRELGHFARPGELREYELVRTLTVDPAADALHAEAGIARPDESYESKLSAVGERVYRLDYEQTQVKSGVGVDSRAARYELAEYLPSLLLALALAEPGLMRWGRSREADRTLDVIALRDRDDIPRALYLDVANGLLSRAEQLVHDPLFGDVLQTVEYHSFESADGLLVPRDLCKRRRGYVEEELARAPADAPVQPLSAPVSHDGTALPPSTSEAAAARPSGVEVEHVGSGLHAVRLVHLDNLTMFLELPEYVVAFEAPRDSDTGELLVETIEAATGHKPIRYLFVSHHHPDFVGGIRPFVARGARIVTTPGNAHYLERIAQAPRQLAPDLQARASRPLALELVVGSREFGAGAQRFTVHDIGRYSEHTDEYLVYAFPAERLLFQGDLVSLKRGAEPSAARPRALGLWRAIAELGLDVERIYGSWPLHGRVQPLPMAALARMVELHAGSRKP